MTLASHETGIGESMPAGPLEGETPLPAGFIVRHMSAEAAGMSRPRQAGRVRKVSVSLPEELTAAVRDRVGPGAFSQYVTEAVARRLELDLLAELAEQLEIEHGPVSEAAIAEAGASWPDAG